MDIKFIVQKRRKMKVGKIKSFNNILPSSSYIKKRSVDKSACGVDNIFVTQYSSLNVKANFMPSFKGLYWVC